MRRAKLKDLSRALALIELGLPAAEPGQSGAVSFDGENVATVGDRSVAICAVRTGLRVALHGRALLDLAGGCGPGATIAPSESGGATIEDGGTVLRLPAAGDREPVRAPKESPGGIELALDEGLASMLEAAAKGADPDSHRPELSGVTVVADGRSLRVYSSDNITCTRLSLSTRSRSASKVVAVLSRPACEAVVKARAIGDGTLRIGADLASVEVDGVGSLYFKPLAVKPEDFERLIAENAEGVDWRPVPEELPLAIRRAKTLTGPDAWRAVSIGATAGAVTVEASGSLGTMRADLPSKGRAAKPYVVGPDFVERALSLCDEIGFGGSALCFRRGDVALVLIARDRGGE